MLDILNFQKQILSGGNFGRRLFLFQTMAFIKAMREGGIVLSEPKNITDFRKPIDYFPDDYWVSWWSVRSKAFPMDSPRLELIQPNR